MRQKLNINLTKYIISVIIYMRWKMENYTWYDFGRLSTSAKKQFLIDVKPSAQKEGRFSLLLYNRYAEQFGLEKIRPSY